MIDVVHTDGRSLIQETTSTCRPVILPAGSKECKMAKMCEICGKKPMVGSNISHAHNVTKRRFEPNLQRVRTVRDGRVIKMMVCTSCIRSGQVVKAP